jgi:dTDP-4-dehydrorhamnose reductase
MRLLVTGAAGQVGREVVDAAVRQGLAVSTIEGRSGVDLTDPAAVRAAVVASRPDVVVNCAAFTAVDACETEIDHAFAVNAHAVGELAAACQSTGARLITLSTDYVFDGTKPDPYVEDDPVNPLSVYGRSKEAGERAALAKAPGAATVVRTSWVCGFHGANMVKTILRLAAGPGTLRFVDDQIGHPTFADDLAAMLVRLALEPIDGLVHVTNAGAVSWYEFAREVVLAAGGDPSQVEPIRTSDLVPARPAPRPLNSRLANQTLTTHSVRPLDDFRVPLERLVRRLSSE